MTAFPETCAAALHQAVQSCRAHLSKVHTANVHKGNPKTRRSSSAWVMLDHNLQHADEQNSLLIGPGRIKALLLLQNHPLS